MANASSRPRSGKGVAADRAAEVVALRPDDLVLLPVGDDVGPPQLPRDEEEHEHTGGDEQLAEPPDEASGHEPATTAWAGVMVPEYAGKVWVPASDTS